MKINFGLFKGKNLLYNVPKNFEKEVRPTSAAVKSVLFNLLTHNSLFSHLPIRDIAVADFCCGTGGVGLEFLSLGAKSCAFFDKHYFNLENIQKHSQTLGISDKIFTQVIDLTEPRHSKKISTNQYDIIFIDPPYEKTNEILNFFLKTVQTNNLLKPNGFVVVESDANVVTEGFETILKRDVRKARFLSFLQQKAN